MGSHGSSLASSSLGSPTAAATHGAKSLASGGSKPAAASARGSLALARDGEACVIHKMAEQQQVNRSVCVCRRAERTCSGSMCPSRARTCERRVELGGAGADDDTPQLGKQGEGVSYVCRRTARDCRQAGRTARRRDAAAAAARPFRGAKAAAAARRAAPARRRARSLARTARQPPRRDRAAHSHRGSRCGRREQGEAPISGPMICSTACIGSPPWPTGARWRPERSQTGAQRLAVARSGGWHHLGRFAGNRAESCAIEAPA